MVSRVAHVLSMRTMLSFMNAKTILLCLATLTFSVLTNCAAKGATLEVLTTREASDSGSSDPSGIDSVKFREDSDGVLSFSQLFYGLDFFCICDGVFWPKCNPDQVFSVHQGLLPKAAVAFLETLNLWSAIVVQTGLAPLMVVFEFTQRVVF